MVRTTLVFCIFLFLGRFALASSCCGSSPSSFLVNFNKESFIFNLSAAQLSSIGRAQKSNQEFVYWDSNKQRDLQIYSLEGSYSFNNRLSLSLKGGAIFSHFSLKPKTNTVSSPLSQTSYQDQNFTDSLVGLNYEALPLYTYHPIRPQIFVSFLLNLPTGRSTYEQGGPEGSSVTGHNLWGAGAGISLYKNLQPYTFILQSKILWLRGDRFDSIKVHNYHDYSLSFSFVANLSSRWSLTSSLTWLYLSPRKVDLGPLESQKNTLSSSTQNTTLSAGLSYRILEELSLNLSYSDQSLIGLPRNTLLNRSLILTLSKIIL